MSEQKQSRVSEAVWPWPGGRETARAGPGPRVRSLVQAGVLAAAGAVLILPLRRVLLGEILLALAGVVLLSGLLIRPLHNAIELLGRAVGGAAGVFLTWVLLAPFFLLCFVPARFILVLWGKDPLRRAFPGRKPSYWVSHPPPADAAGFRRQY